MTCAGEVEEQGGAVEDGGVLTGRELPLLRVEQQEGEVPVEGGKRSLRHGSSFSAGRTHDGATIQAEECRFPTAIPMLGMGQNVVDTTDARGGTVPEEQTRSRLAEWGSRKRTRKETALFWTVLLAVVAGFCAVMVWAGGGVQDETAAREEQLNERYEESVSVELTQVGGNLRERIILDGVQRPDCDSTEDGYLECSDDPQPTLTDE